VDGLLEGVTIGREGQVPQWASEATASSQYAADDGAARQATGPPESPDADSRTAWAVREADGGLEWLRVKFVLPGCMRRIRIHENLTPGGVIQIVAVGEDGRRSPVWEGTDLALPWFEADLKSEVAQELVIVVDTRKHAGWEEIDAVELIGDSSPIKKKFYFNFMLARAVPPDYDQLRLSLRLNEESRDEPKSPV
jgi:hypothetical protein